MRILDRVRGLSPLLLACAASAALAGCGGGSGGGGGSGLTTADLPNLVLQQSEAPPGLAFSQKDSGSNILERKNGAQAVSTLKGYGLEGDYGAQFLSKAGKGKVSSAESLALLFKDSTGASKVLRLSKQQATGRGTVAKEISSSGLGEEAWGLRGAFFNSRAPVTYFYTWRIKNAVLSLIVAGGSETGARALAGKLNAHAEGAGQVGIRRGRGRGRFARSGASRRPRARRLPSRR